MAETTRTQKEGSHKKAQKAQNSFRKILCLFVAIPFSCLLGLLLTAGIIAGQDITIQDLRNGFKDPSRWLSYSGDYTSQRHSPLTQITPANVNRLAAQWTFQSGITTEGRGFEKHWHLVPLIQGRRAQRGKPTAYVCRKNVCDLPTSDPAIFARQLAKTMPLFPDRSPAPLPAANR